MVLLQGHSRAVTLIWVTDIQLGKRWTGLDAGPGGGGVPFEEKWSFWGVSPYRPVNEVNLFGFVLTSRSISDSSGDLFYQTDR